MTSTTLKPLTPSGGYKSVTSTTLNPLTTAGIPIQHRSDHFRPENTLQPPILKNETKKPKSHSQKPSGFLPLLHSIQETLTSNAKKSLKSKISLLSDLRDNLLMNIDERMSRMWRGDVESRGHDDHEMEFPSNEGALMTIGFLTFAVFLIKLVLKLIHALKNKESNMMVVTTATPIKAGFIGRRKRGLDDEDSVKILQYIDQYEFS